MKPVHDQFSGRADYYAKHRPVYPDSLYDYLNSLLNTFDLAWDCGTGNGQVAVRLSEKFKRVYATDISEAQLSKAISKQNIEYVLSRAEQTKLADHSVDLITIAQALHWFDFDAFYQEIARVAKPDACIAAWAYYLPTVSDSVDSLLHHFYTVTTGPYWDDARKFIDEKYLTIPFPFKELAAPSFEMVTEWNADDYLGFLHSWSAVQHYINAKNENPVDLISSSLLKIWKKEEVKQLKFPMFLRIGKIS